MERYLFLLIPAFLVISLIVGFVQQGLRRRKLAETAESLGLEFLPGGDNQLKRSLSEFPLMSRGRSGRMKNLMRGASGSITTAMFDYSYRTRSGEESSTRHTCAFLMEREGTRLPQFQLQPEGFFHRLGETLGMQDIDFDSHPQFSKMFQLKGRDEEEIRRYFQPGLLDLLEGYPGITVEADGSRLLVYRQRRRPSAKAIAEFMQDGLTIGQALQQYGD